MSKATFPPSLRQIALFLQRLPGIGEKSAQRLAFYLLRLPEPDLQTFALHLAELKKRTKRCEICMNLTEEVRCGICQDPTRDRTRITVVEDVLDLVSLNTGEIYDGLFHVLHGRIDPLNHIGPEHIFIDALLARLDPINNFGVAVSEIILATNPDMEGEATALYIRNQLKKESTARGIELRITRLGYGMPMGGNLEYADYMTLRKALENRQGM